MKKILLFILFLLFSSSAFAWSVVQSVNASGKATGVTTAITATGTGNLIVVVVEIGGSGVASSITDSAGDTFISTGDKGDMSTQRNEIWYAMNSIPGSTTVTVNFSGGSTCRPTIYEVSGMATAGALDANSSNSNQTSSTSIVTPTITTTYIGDFIVAFGNPTNSVTAVSSGWTLDFTTGGYGWAHLTSSTAAAGSQSATFTQDISGSFGTNIASFKPKTQSGFFSN